MIIEDNPQNALLMKRLLQVRYDIIHAEEGGIGLEMAATADPDLILVDFGLPDMDGQTLVGLLKHDPKLCQIPIVAVTAWPEETARHLAKIYGCDDFISKPINTKTFLDQISQYIKTQDPKGSNLTYAHH